VFDNSTNDWTDNIFFGSVLVLWITSNAVADSLLDVCRWLETALFTRRTRNAIGDCIRNDEWRCIRRRGTSGRRNRRRDRQIAERCNRFSTGPVTPNEFSRTNAANAIARVASLVVNRSGNQLTSSLRG
jgi:hypothetical protein